MSATNAFETALLSHLFLNDLLADWGTAQGLRQSTSAGSLYVSLHTSDPGEATSDQTQNETTYLSYARQAVSRSVAGWSLSGPTIQNAALITFPECSGGSSATITHWGIGSAVTGSGSLFLTGSVSTPLSVSSGITPEIGIGDLNVTFN